MNFEMIKQIKDNILLKRIIFVLLAFIIFLYLKAFFTTGVYFNGFFLKKATNSNETHYIGEGSQGEVQVIVNGWANDKRKSTAEVAFILPNMINEHYTVNFSNVEEWLYGNVEIKNESNNTIFEGKYQKGNTLLIDLNNEPVFEGYMISIANGKNEVIYDNNYRIPLLSIVQLSLHENETIRGHGGMLFAAMVIIFLTFLDVKYPLFFFQLRHSLDVEDPKPTEFYIAMQKVGWVINSVIALVLLIIAI